MNTEQMTEMQKAAQEMIDRDQELLDILRRMKPEDQKEYFPKVEASMSATRDFIQLNLFPRMTTNDKILLLEQVARIARANANIGSLALGNLPAREIAQLARIMQTLNEAMRLINNLGEQVQPEEVNPKLN